MSNSKSLAELESSAHGKPEFESSLAERCQELWHYPIDAMTAEDLRLLIGQRIGLKFLIPVALDILENNPFAAGDMYAGDLLANLLMVPNEFWERFPDLNNRVVELKHEIEILRDTLNEELLPAMSNFEYR